MDNYKPACKRFDELQVKILNEIGFKTEGMWNRAEQVITTDSKSVYKHYDICGGSFCFKINLDNYYFGDKHIIPYAKIVSPYDSWWHEFWKIDKFLYDLDSIKENITKDIWVLCAIEILTIDDINDEDESCGE